MVDDIFIVILTSIVYLLANGFTYHIGTSNSQNCAEPLYDVLHDILPDWSGWVWIRDIVLVLFWIPLLATSKRKEVFCEFLSVFMHVVLAKAVLIFFTFVPPSNSDCHKKKYLNHCFHNAVSGHAAMAGILMILYHKYCGFPLGWAIVITMMYSCLIILTRAHYTKDILEALMIVAIIL